MNQETIAQNQIECDKCGGDGKNYAPAAYEFFRFWRKKIGAKQNQVAFVLKVDVAQLSKFENGSLGFSEKRMRKLAEILSGWND